MLRTSSASIARLRSASVKAPIFQCRTAATQQTPKEEGDISSVFRSLSGSDESEKLPQRFAEVKRGLVKDKSALHASWNRLLATLRDETHIVKSQGSACIPSIDFTDIQKAPQDFSNALRKRGVAIIRQVVPENEARAFKEETERYVAANPSTKAFPADNPAVFELYWSRPQLAGRLHKNMIDVQKFLMSYYHSQNPNALCSTQQPLTYADRIRIRQPGDAGFALGPHVDGGSVERWEENGYGKGHVYDKVFEGKWEQFDPWELSTRLEASQDLHNGAGACSMFRMFQGWLSMSHTGPREGTLLVNPLLSLSTAYYLLRPFFAPKNLPMQLKDSVEYSAQFLDPENWVWADENSPDLQGAWPGNGQELNHKWHPHLDLPHTMVHFPQISPGDYVAWHCDTIHAVDSVHEGNSDSSVMYIPACPTTKANVEYARQQREHFLQGIPPTDFPGGVGESQHVGRPDANTVMSLGGHESLRSFGFSPFDVSAAKEHGEIEMLKYANQVMGF